MGLVEGIVLREFATGKLGSERSERKNPWR